jgi:hypothetical protein
MKYHEISYCLHQVIRGKEGYQGEGHFRLIWSMEVKLCNVTNSPNSCPPERLFSVFNTTYHDDQKSSHTDYIQLSIQSQFNKRTL